MALARTPYTQATSSTAGTSFTTGSYTFPNDSLVVVIVHTNNTGLGENPAALLSIDDTGADLTWTKRVYKDLGNGGDFLAAVAIFTATGNGTSCTLTISKTGVNAERWVVQPYTYTGHDAASPVGATFQQTSNVSDGSWTATLSGAPASTSHVIAALGGTLDSGTATVTHGTGWTELYDITSSNWYVHQAQVRTGSTSTSVVWDDIIVGAAYYGEPSTVGIEIKEAAAGGYTITADSGTYSVSGSEAYRDIVMAAAQGSYTQTGQDASFNTGHTLIAEYGSYALVGSDGLIDLSMTAAQGTFTLTGVDAVLNKTFLMAAGSGSFTMTGNIADLVWSNPPSPTPIGATLRSTRRGFRTVSWIRRG